VPPPWPRRSSAACWSPGARAPDQRSVLCVTTGRGTGRVEIGRSRDHALLRGAPSRTVQRLAGETLGGS
jgi:hypothetical protein